MAEGTTSMTSVLVVVVMLQQGQPTLEWTQCGHACIRMCDHIPGRPPRLSAVTLDKTLSNHVLYLNCILTSHWCACI